MEGIPGDGTREKALFMGLPLYQQETENEYVVPHASSVMDFTVDVEPTKTTSWHCFMLFDENTILFGGMSIQLESKNR